MDIRIDNSSDVPIWRQLTEQIIFLIAIERLRGGEPLPSVRELARRLKIHHNTVSEAYQDLVRRKWLDRRRGSRLTVISRKEPEGPSSLDDLINQTIATARENGYSLQQLRERVRQRLLAEPPDHILLVEQDEGLRRLIQAELSAELDWPVRACSREELERSPGLAVGALGATAHHAMRQVSALFPKDRPVVALRYAPADTHLQTIRTLPLPSVIAVVSISAVFLEVARGLLAPALGKRHQLREILLTEETAEAARGAELVFCDSIARKHLRLKKVIPYGLVQPESIIDVSAVMNSYRE